MSAFDRYLNPSQPPIHWWQGRSGYWYIHSIYSIDSLPELGACNYVFARPAWSGNGLREALYVGQTGDGSSRLSLTRHEKFQPALRLGATEIHVHFLANSRQARFDIETDIRGGHCTPLNEQQTPVSGLDTGALSAFGSLAGCNLLTQSVPAKERLSALSTLAGFGECSSLIEALSPNFGLNALFHSIS